MGGSYPLRHKIRSQSACPGLDFPHRRRMQLHVSLLHQAPTRLTCTPGSTPPAPDSPCSPAPATLPCLRGRGAPALSCRNGSVLLICARSRIWFEHKPQVVLACGSSRRTWPGPTSVCCPLMLCRHRKLHLCLLSQCASSSTA